MLLLRISDTTVMVERHSETAYRIQDTCVYDNNAQNFDPNTSTCIAGLKFRRVV